MAKYIVEIEATQWWKNGDHPLDACETFDGSDGPFLGEGNVVRYYRTPQWDGKTKCLHCSDIMHWHGWIDTLEGGHIVCPGDFIITGLKGEYYPCKPDIFKLKYQVVK